MVSNIDTGTEDLLANLQEGVLTITLNRPEARNAMSGAMTTALAQQLANAELNTQVRCVVLFYFFRFFSISYFLIIFKNFKFIL